MYIRCTPRRVFLFSMFVNDLEYVYCEKGISGIDIDSFKVFRILYADDIVIFGSTAEELQENLYILEEYCNRWKLIVKDKDYNF